ncbi:MAG: M23 family metallopeptidase [Bacteroidetes bacterium]|nr:M23 family metallopeptidase [Bacteroidota bacterium]MBI3482519.1 M23 family metallopeptidase [Bacteroidota bacterium]
MKPKKTISERLTAPYQLVVRSEENLAERRTLSFTYAKLIVILSSVFFLIFIASLFLSKTLLAKWFDPKYELAAQKKQLISLAQRLDSLAIEEDRKEKFIQNFQRILRGDTSSGFVDPAKVLKANTDQVKSVGNMKLAPADSQFRKEFEQSQFSFVSLNSKYRELQDIFFFTPITGFISDKYDSKKGHFGVDIVAKTNEPVKCVADGTVVMSSWTQDAGYVIAVQHRGSLVSVYKHNAGLLKKVGSFVNAGDIISIVGNSGEMTDGPHLHFEMWYNGNSLNPEEFVTF